MASTKLWISKVLNRTQNQMFHFDIINGKDGYMDESLDIFDGAGNNVTHYCTGNCIFFDENEFPYDERTLDELRLGYKFYIEGLKV